MEQNRPSLVVKQPTLMLPRSAGQHSVVGCYNKILCAMVRCNDQTACKKRNKLYLRARKSKDPDDKIHYKRFRPHVQKELRDTYWKYVSNIFTFEKDSSDPDTPKSK